VLKPIGLVTGLDDVAVVREPIEQRGGKARKNGFVERFQVPAESDAQVALI
jgi:hypothetical protein